jgi:phosphohistidine swiveling domain-containing protein
LFTQDPVAPGQILVELAKGTADDLVSGRVTPLSLRYGKYTFQKMDKVISPIELTKLLEMARDVEKLFGCPQDIEWTYCAGVFSVVQTRDITTLTSGSVAEVARQKEWQKLFQKFNASPSDNPILKQDEMSEVLPRPTPFSFSVMSSLWTAGGSVDRACHTLGLHYEAPETRDGYLYQLFGKVYSDVALKSNAALQLPKWVEKDLENRSDQVEHQLREDFLPRLWQKLEYWDAIDNSKLALKNQLEMVDEVIQYFVNDVYAFAEQINILASFLNLKAAKACETQGLDMLKVMQAPTPHAPIQIIANVATLPKEEQKNHLLQVMGHRAVFDYELSFPRYSENPEMLWKLAQTNVLQIKQESDTSILEVPASLPKIVELALRYEDLKEYAKHESIRVLSVLRKLLLEIDTHFGDCGYVFHLTYQEVLQIEEKTLQNLRDLSITRYETSQSLKEFAPTLAALSLRDCEILSNPQSQIDDQFGDLQGVCVSGDKDVIGKIYLAPENQDADVDCLVDFSPGDILVCKMINPVWLPYVLQSKAVVSEVGGWLSHMAIVAREHKIPMVVGCSGLGRLRHGDKVRVSRSGQIESLAVVAESIPMKA